MLRLLKYIADAGCRTQKTMFPDLPENALGLPTLSGQVGSCDTECNTCLSLCPTSAIELESSPNEQKVKLDLGACVSCGLCIENCPTKTIYKNSSTQTAKNSRSELVLCAEPANAEPARKNLGLFKKSLAVRVVSTGCSACDLEVGASFNAIFDASRFGISYVASPRAADALLVTGPCPQGMHDALKRTYEAMPEPKIVIACGTCAVSGGMHKGGYAKANGLEAVLPVDIFIPGCPPHPWSIIHGMQKAMKL